MNNILQGFADNTASWVTIPKFLLDPLVEYDTPNLIYD
jgi:hypothetical protein